MEWLYQSIPEFYQRVRASLNATIDDATIDFFENAPLAETKIKQRVPNWEELDETNTLLFQTCIVYMTCYALCPLASSLRVKRQKDPSLEIEFGTSDQQNPCDRFLAMIDDLIAQITGEEPQNLFGFRVTSGSGYRCAKPCWPYVHSRNAFDPL